MSYANYPAVREEGSAQQFCGRKMADEQSSHGTAFSGASDTDEPASKRTKMSPVANHVFKPTEAEPFSCVSAAAESREAAVNRAQQQKEAEPVMAVEQAPAARGRDNNGAVPPGSEPYRPAGKLSESAVFGATEDNAGGLDETGVKRGRLRARRPDQEQRSRADRRAQRFNAQQFTTSLI